MSISTQIPSANTGLVPQATVKPAAVKVPFVDKFVVGAAAGMIGTTFVYPLDRLKTALMTSTGSRGLFGTLRHLVADHGVRGMYRGLGTNLVGVAPEKAIKLGANDYLRERFAAANVAAGGKGLLLWQEIVAAMVAGTVQASVTNPAELLKIRVQVDRTKSAVQWVKHLGVSGLYRGVGSTLLRDVPFSVVFFPLYANLRTATHKLLDVREGGANAVGGAMDVGGTISAGIFSGAIAAGLVTPVDVVKTRIQAPGGLKRYGGMLECAKTIAREEGHGALWKGVIPRSLVVGTLYGVSMLSFELLKSHIANRDVPATPKVTAASPADVDAAPVDRR